MDTDRAQDPHLAEPPATLTRDRWWVTVAAVVWIAGSLFGTGLIGGGVEQQGDGLFSDSATLIAPMGPAFSIWSVIYLGLAAYVGWQWLPTTARSRWAARTRLPAGIAIALNGVPIYSGAVSASCDILDVDDADAEWTSFDFCGGHGRCLEGPSEASTGRARPCRKRAAAATIDRGAAQAKGLEAPANGGHIESCSALVTGCCNTPCSTDGATRPDDMRCCQ